MPLTADADLWVEAVDAGRELLWLHTYAERFANPTAGRDARVPDVEGVEWIEPVRQLPEDMGSVRYDPEVGTLAIGDGLVGGVRPDVWAYSVSGMTVLSKWLGYRTRKGAGRAVSSSSALDRIRREAWPDEWNDELLDLTRILTLTLDKQEDLAGLLDRVCEGPLIPAGTLPTPADAERQPPPTAR